MSESIKPDDPRPTRLVVIEGRTYRVYGDPIEEAVLVLQVQREGGVELVNYDATSGADKLWAWFGLDRASWLVLPRVLMHAMPDDWQARMAQLLREYDEAFHGKDDLPTPYVSAKDGVRFTRWPPWLLLYRHPDREAIESIRRKRCARVAE